MGLKKKAEQNEIHRKEMLYKTNKGVIKNKLVEKLAKDAPDLLNNAALEYLRNDWNSNIKCTLPESLDAIGHHDKLREKMVKLKYIVQF